MSRTRFWALEPELQRELIAIGLSRYGKLVGNLQTPYSQVFTFDQPGAHPRFVVAKTIKIPPDASDEQAHQFIQRTLREVNNLFPYLHHESVHRIPKVEVYQGLPFLISPKRHATLYDIVREGSEACELNVALEIMVQVAHGLNYCQAKGLVTHQDLKPENIFLDFIDRRFRVDAGFPQKFIAKIADFELANACRVFGKPQGSRPYMAPEQYLRENLGDVDFSKTDVFACGVMLFEAITGGVHPVGERTSLLWPKPAEDKPRKWGRDEAWKTWARREDRTNALSLLPELVRPVVDKSLKVSVEDRVGMREFESMLWKCLFECDKPRALQTQLLLASFDATAEVSEEAGWPSYEETLRKVNDWFGSGS